MTYEDGGSGGVSYVSRGPSILGVVKHKRCRPLSKAGIVCSLPVGIAMTRLCGDHTLRRQGKFGKRACEGVK